MYTLKIGDKIISLQEGETVRVEGIFQNPEVTLTVEPYNLFSAAGIRFKYPREFIVDADLEKKHVKSWTLSGNDFKILYFVFDVPVQIEDYLESMLARYGRQNCTVTGAAPLTFGPVVLTGTTIKTTVTGIKMALHIYQLPSSGMPLKLLVLQDCLGSSGNPSTEAMYAIQLFEQSSSLEV
jgi:hypothetical protein